MARGNERTPEGCEWKHTIVGHILRASEREEGLLDALQWKDLSVYERQGIMYVAAEPRVVIAEKIE